MGRSGPPGEWVQLTGKPGHHVERGFSGAGVVDDATGDVIGMLVAAHTDRSSAVSWMLPVDAIVRYVPGIEGCAHGDSAVDRSLALIDGFETLPRDEALARTLVRLLGGTGAVLIVVGSSDSSQAATLRRAVVLGDRELRPAAAERAPADTVPPVGSVDLAIDASGKTADEVSRRIVDRIGIAGDESTDPSDRVRDDAPSMTLVVDAVDEADDPEVLVSRVLAPLAARAVERDIRLLIGFRSASAHSLQVLVAERLDQLDALVADVARAEEVARQRHRDVAPRIANAPEVPMGSISLRLALTALRMETDIQRLLSGLGSLERAAVRALSRAHEVRRGLDELLAGREELRGRLDGYRVMAAALGLVEDVELNALHQEAAERLAQWPCDLVVAAELVQRYVLAVAVRSGRDADEDAP